MKTFKKERQKEFKKNIKRRDLKPQKDPKGGVVYISDIPITKRIDKGTPGLHK